MLGKFPSQEKTLVTRRRGVFLQVVSWTVLEVTNYNRSSQVKMSKNHLFAAFNCCKLIQIVTKMKYRNILLVLRMQPINDPHFVTAWITVGTERDDRARALELKIEKTAF